MAVGLLHGGYLRAVTEMTVLALMRTLDPESDFYAMRGGVTVLVTGVRVA